jgi:3-hydroxyacyl-CoA dehydrogenase/enoyl-CoA hydratase/3-hydroxybutyryl-CoA epimerase
MCSDFTKKIGKDNIAVITWNCLDKSMNTMTEGGLRSFKQVVTEALSEEKIKGIIITSGKVDFSGGMDLSTLEALKRNSGPDPASKIFEYIMEGHSLLRKIELGKMDDASKSKPVAFAGGGICAGIGTEIGLACHRRFFSSSKRSKIGLPEILVGLFPGLGGTTRIPRMMGLMGASSVLLEGKLFTSEKAKSIGLVDELVPENELIQKAKDWILSVSPQELVKPWDQKGFKFPGGAPYHPSGFMSFVGGSALVNGKTKGLYFSAKALLSSVYEGALVDFDSALRIEARWFTKVLMTDTCTNMARTLFLNKSALEKGQQRPSDVKETNLKQISVIGSGMMGSGIAYASILQGLEVLLIDQNIEAAEAGKTKIDMLLSESVKRKKLSEEEKIRLLEKVKTVSSLEKISSSDLVIEAVFEDLKLKHNLYKKIEPHLKDGAILASNTSTLPITKLSEVLTDSTRFIGIHFFSPVDRMNLVELIKSEKTNDYALAVALDYTSMIKKTPIVVNDSRGFYANRCIIPYINEGLRMLSEGIEPALIENSAKQIGMPVGPLQLLDELSVTLALNVAKETKEALGTKYQETGTESILLEMSKNNRLGRKELAGFYEYDEKGRRIKLWEGLRNLNVENTFANITAESVKSRLAYVQALEAVRAFEENILLSVEEGDVGGILGWGCLIWAGGPFSWLDHVGHEKVVVECQDLSDQYGARFTPPKIIKELASSGRKFYN